jgi:hypothetical protein
MTTQQQPQTQTIIQPPTQQQQNMQIFEMANKCKIDLMGVKTTGDALTNASNQPTFDNINNAIGNLKDLSEKYDYSHYKCAIDNSDELKNMFNTYCENPNYKPQMVNFLNMIDMIIDKHGKDSIKIFGKYIDIFENLEKDCYKTQDPVLIKKLKTILEKIGKLTSNCPQIPSCQICPTQKPCPECKKDNDSFLKSNYQLGWIIAIICIVIIAILLSKKMKNEVNI